jgi:hypothetical protein
MPRRRTIRREGTMPSFFEFLVFAAAVAMVLRGGGPRPPRLTLVRGALRGERRKAARGRAQPL